MVTLPPARLPTPLTTAVVTTTAVLALSKIPTAPADEATRAAETGPTITSSLLSMMPYTTPWRASRSIP